MRYYTKIPFWENKRRLTLLQKFRELVVLYYDNTDAHWMVEGRIESDRAREIRVEINRMINEIHSIINMSDINTMTYYTPPPAIGGYAHHIDLILNIFELQSYRIGENRILDYIDRAIGVYQNDFIPSILRTINPFYWIGIILDYIVSLPFILIGKAGFNQKKAEVSFLGKFLKIIFYLMSGTAAFLAILNYLGYLDNFKRIIQTICIK